MKYRIVKVQREYSNGNTDVTYVIERSLLGVFWSQIKYPKQLSFNPQPSKTTYEFDSLQQAEDVLWVEYISLNQRQSMKF